VELARILLCRHDVLLLDEPTNHLDNDARDWVLGFLAKYRGALLVISHDLELLDAASRECSTSIDDGTTRLGTLVEYKGHVLAISVRPTQGRRAPDQDGGAARAEVERLQKIVDRFGAKATKASMAHSLEKRIVRIESDAVSAPSRQRTLKVKFPEPPAAGRTVLEVADVAKSYGSLDVFDHVTFDVGRGERLLILGLNGAGKTSLLRILAGTSEADEGQVQLRSQRVGGLLRAGTRGHHQRPNRPRPHAGADRRSARRRRATPDPGHVRPHG